jgi:flagellar motor protein MotB
VRGHTDAHPYRSRTYDNWRLSSARAQMAYYMLEYAIPVKYLFLLTVREL